MKGITAVSFGFAIVGLAVGFGYLLGVTYPPKPVERSAPIKESISAPAPTPAEPSGSHTPVAAPLPQEGTVVAKLGALACKDLSMFTDIMTAVNADDTAVAAARIRTGLSTGNCRGIEKGERVFVHKNIGDHYICIRGSNDPDCVWTLLSVAPPPIK